MNDKKTWWGSLPKPKRKGDSEHCPECNLKVTQENFEWELVQVNEWDGGGNTFYAFVEWIYIGRCRNCKTEIKVVYKDYLERDEWHDA